MFNYFEVLKKVLKFFQISIIYFLRDGNNNLFLTNNNRNFQKNFLNEKRPKKEIRKEFFKGFPDFDNCYLGI